MSAVLVGLLAACGGSSSTGPASTDAAPDGSISASDATTPQAPVSGRQFSASELAKALNTPDGMFDGPAGKASTVFDSDHVPGSGGGAAMDNLSRRGVTCESLLHQSLPTLGAGSAGVDAFAFAQYTNAEGDEIDTELLSQYRSPAAAASALAEFKSAASQCTGSLKEHLTVDQDEVDGDPEVSLIAVSQQAGSGSGVSSAPYLGLGAASIVHDNLLATSIIVTTSEDDVADLPDGVRENDQIMLAQLPG